MNFLKEVFKEFAQFSGKPISKSIFQLLFLCKVRTRAGDNNRLYENLWYENRHKSVVIHIHIQSTKNLSLFIYCRDAVE